MTAIPVPSQIANFEVIRRLGAGGMAEVFLAKKRGAEETFKTLVVKRILPSHGQSRRFKSMFIEEAQLATRLNHPNVVQVYEFFDAGEEGHILAMEYVDGIHLGQLMHAAKTHAQQQAVQTGHTSSSQARIGHWLSAWIVAEAAKGLHYAHERKDEQGQALEIVHRDVSPQNILLSFEGTVKITDFGIASARLVEEESGVLKGKFGYMSPEQARGERVDRRSDLYSLGVIMWESLTGRPLHGGLGGEALLDIVRSGEVEAPSTYNRDIPEELESIVMKLLAKERDKRFENAREVASAISRCLLQKQQLMDATVLEARINELVPVSQREIAVPLEPRTEDLLTNAAVPGARSQNNSDGRLRHEQDSQAPAIQLAKVVDAREVRHVVLVTLRIDVGADISRNDAGLLRSMDRLRKMMGEMAYKRGMRWVWRNDWEARAVAGLALKHARAPFEAGQLALETHEALAGYKDEFPFGVTAAVSLVRGIASGSRDMEGNLVRYVLHDAVEEFADVLNLATPTSCTWVAGGLYRLIWRDFAWGQISEMSLEGKVNSSSMPARVKIYGLSRALSREERAREFAGELVGRDAERADLFSGYHAAVHAAAGGNVVARVVMGELGIGKSALVSSFIDDLHRQVQGEITPRVLRVECTPVTMELPFGVIAELLREAIGATGEESFEEISKRIASVGGEAAEGDSLHPVVARLAEIASKQRKKQQSDDDGGDAKRLVLSGLRNLLAAISLAEPLVLVLESFQWADRQSLDLFVEILRTSDPLPILVLVVTRPEDRLSHLLEGKVRIELDPLTHDEQVRLLESRLGVKKGVREVCAELMPRVGGNPFFLLEMVDALLERGVLEIHEYGEGGENVPTLVRTERGEELGDGLPSTLEQLLLDRMRELPSDERELADWIAVAGGPLRVDDLLELSSVLGDEPMGRLCARGVCERRGEVLDFRHPLTREVLYAALDPQNRVFMHGELGEHLSKAGNSTGLAAAMIAKHFARGNLPERAADFYLEAAYAARSSNQLQLSARYFQRALSSMEPRDPRCEQALDGLEGIYRALGRRKERRRALERLRTYARRSENPRRVALALVRTARFHLDEGKLARGLVVVRGAVEIARSANSAQLAIETESLYSEFLRELGDVQGALAACDRALAASDPKVNRSVSGRTFADVLRGRGVLLRRVGRVREAVDCYADAIAYAKRSGAKRLEARTKNALAYAMFVQGRYEDAITLALESIQIDLAMGGRFQLAKTLTNIGHSYSRLGDQQRAIAYLDRAREAHERYGDEDGRADTLLVCAEVNAEAGNIDAAQGFLETAVVLNDVTGNAYDRTHALLVEAVLARSTRDFKRAIAAALNARRTAESQALVAYSFYGLALEAAARVDAGEVHTGTLLATTALGSVETIQGCEYGLEIRVLCADALKRTGSPQAAAARQRAMDHTSAMLGTVRDQRLRKAFCKRPIVAGLFDTTPVPVIVPETS
ncbi:MAG: protein kinase [Polyangiaceae bacterium]